MSDAQSNGVDMGEYTRHDLMRMSATEAQSELTDEQFAEWARINDLQEDLQQTRAEFNESREMVIDAAVEHHEDEYAESGEWHGNEIVYELDPERITEMPDEVQSLIDGASSGTPDHDSIGDVKDAYAQAFAALWKRFNDVDLTDEAREDVVYWARYEVVEKWGVRDCGLILGEQITQALEREKELQEAVNKFHGEMGADSGGPPAHNGTWKRR